MRAVAGALVALGFGGNVLMIWHDCHTKPWVSMQWEGWVFAAVNVAFGAFFVYFFGWVM